MPRATQKSKVNPSTSLRARIQKSKVMTEVNSSQVSEKLPGPLKNFKVNKFTITAVVIIGLALLFTYKKNWIVAASVNGSPISNFEVLSRLNSQYRTQILNQMINEQIILQELKKNNLSITQKDIDDKIASLEKIYGGTEAFDNILAQEGLTRDKLRNPSLNLLTISIAGDKLYSNEATVSAQEVADFIIQYQGQLQATDSAGMQKEAEDALIQQKLGKIFNQKFPELKSAAKVSIY